MNLPVQHVFPDHALTDTHSLEAVCAAKMVPPGMPTRHRSRLLLLAALAAMVRPCAFVTSQAGWLSRSRDNLLGKASCAASSGTFEEKREALKACLAREYRSFFRPFEADFYSEDVSFTDPLNQLKGKASYRANVEMLSGNSVIGNILFTDAFIDLHSVEEVPGDETRLRTRWTLGFAFKLLPWRPRAVFSGVSEYTIDPENAKVLTQRDYWDVLSLEKGGSYVPEMPLTGLQDHSGFVFLASGGTLEQKRDFARLKCCFEGLGISAAASSLEAAFAVEAPAFDGGLAGVRQEMKARASPSIALGN
eukprot:symbB.v1.2.010779.t1/scaffold709.1/size267679/22